MQYALTLSCLLALAYSPSLPAQCVVSQDTNQRLITRCETRGGLSSQNLNAAQAPGGVVTRLYQGSPCLTFPVWQPGMLQLDASSKPITGSLQYDVAANQVYYLTPEGKSELVRPTQFTIQDRSFMVQPAKGVGKRTRSYYEILYQGPTRLLAQHRRRLVPFFVQQPTNGSGTGQAWGYDGRYEETTHYYLLTPDSPTLKAITLSSQSVLGVLAKSSDLVKQQLATPSVTLDQVVSALRIYDSRVAQ